MKTYAYINTAGDVVGIGMIYFESGELTPEVAALVARLGGDAGITAYGEKVKPDSAYATVVVDTAQFPGGAGMNYDKTFRNAFKRGAGLGIAVDMPKAKDVTHAKRRAKRALEMAPLDIEATIPSKAAQAEAARQALRDKYAVMQTEIDAATTPEMLKAIITREGL